jgi:hypothetical protein
MVDLEDGDCHFRCFGDFPTYASGRNVVLSFGVWEDVRIGFRIRRIGTRCFGQHLSDLDLFGITFGFSHLRLRSVTIPSTVTILGFQCFSGCTDIC